MISISRNYRVLWLLIFFLALAFLWAFTAPPAYADGGAPNLAYVAGTTQGISTVDIGQQKVTGTFKVAGDPRSVMLSADGRFLYVAQPTSGSVTMLAARTGATICSAKLAGQPSLLTFDPTPSANTLYAAGNGDSTVSAIDSTNCAIKRTFHTSGPVYGLGFAQISSGSTNSNQLWVSNTSAVTIFDTAGKQLSTITIPGGPQYLSIPPGTMAYVTTRQGGVDAIDIGSYKVFPLISGGKYGPMDYDAITGDVYVPDQQHNALVVLTPLSSGGNPLPPEPNHTYNLGVAPESVAITSDGQLGFVALSGGNVAMLDVPGKQIVNTIFVGGNPDFIITGLYPPVVGTTPQQAAVWSTVINILAYVVVIALFIVPLLIFRRYSRTGAKSKEKKKF
jgi:DNA-binding beta-propeller fold protein YncE